MHGAPIQCTKGKCSKAFHVSCAAGGAAAGVAYRVVEEVEKEVLLLEPVLAARSEVDDFLTNHDGGGTTEGTNVNQQHPTTDTIATPGVPPEPTPPVSSAVPPTPPSLASSPASLPPPVVQPTEGARVIKTIKKHLVEVLCAQHNPVRLTNMTHLSNVFDSVFRCLSHKGRRTRTTRCELISQRSMR